MMKASNDLYDEILSALLRNLTEVGSTKPIGYLPLYSIPRFLDTTPEALATAIAARGLATAKFTGTQCCIESGAFYAYHREALGDLLHAHADIVRGAGLPLDPDNFVARIAAVWFDQDHPIYQVIAAAFGNKG